MTCGAAQSGYIYFSEKRCASQLYIRNASVSLPTLVNANSVPSSAQGWGRVGQQILNLRQRAAERRALDGLDRRDLDDCGLTLADMTIALPDLYANDFRVAQIANLRAA
jgi:uncharacterized protein YjiS (DUF1127 family)